MPDLTIVGSQWGDEGKGKIADYLAGSADMVVRFQGGPNAGHTVCHDGAEFTFHQIPSGILSERVRCVVGCGCVLDPYVLNRELVGLRRHGVAASRRLLVDARAHLIAPYHRVLDNLREQQSGSGRLGTTGCGIGPAYSDKSARSGIRAHDVLSEEDLRAKLRVSISAANFLLMERYKAEPLPLRKTVDDYLRATRTLARLVGDGSRAIEDGLRADQRVLFEGAQGMHLDIDLGTYPYVTSSSTWAGGVASGTGISPVWITEVVGVAKAYTTRVGLGPFPTEMPAVDSDNLRRRGHEYGATTGRPRRCGWFDAPLVRAAVRHNRLAALVITKLDVLDSFDEIKVCRSYRCAGQSLSEFDPLRAAELEPVYSAVPGWREPTHACTLWRELPSAARRYIRLLEDECGCPVAIVSTGKDRTQTIVLRPRVLGWLNSADRRGHKPPR